MEIQRLAQGLAHWVVCQEVFSIYATLMSSSSDPKEMIGAMQGMPHSTRSLAHVVAHLGCRVLNAEAAIEAIKTRSV